MPLETILAWKKPASRISTAHGLFPHDETVKGMVKGPFLLSEKQQVEAGNRMPFSYFS